jgi:hypothetical protein
VREKERERERERGKGKDCTNIKMEKLKHECTATPME